MPSAKTTREQWLSRAVDELRPLFKQAKAPVPKKVRVGVGFPKGRKFIGECWATTCSADKTSEIFISPAVAKPDVVLEVLVHELCHAAAGYDAKHGKEFKAVAEAVGLEGKMKSTYAGEELVEKLHRIAKTLGKYPHAVLTPGEKPKQSTRLIKVSCPSCGYVARVTRKWLDDPGPPVCPTDSVALVEDVKE